MLTLFSWFPPGSPHFLAVFCLALADKVAASVFHWMRGFLSLQMMSGRRMRPDLTNHNTVLANAGAAGAWTMALVVKERINHLRLGPDVITYNGSISACHKAPGKGGFFGGRKNGIWKSS